MNDPSTIDDEHRREPSAPPARPRRARRWPLRLGPAVALVALVGGLYLGAWRMHAKRLLELEPGVLVRVGQPTELGLWYLVRVRGVRTVLSFQTCDVQLRHGLFDPGKPSGADEHEFVEQLGARHLQWPWGEEPYWPWPTPWVYEEYFRLIDDPTVQPIAIHCAGGRHRTGTMSALYRLEYDRWPIDRVLSEMYSYDFGPAVALHEHNLRTYALRPRPTEQQLAGLVRRFRDVAGEAPPADYDELVRLLRSVRGKGRVDELVAQCLSEEVPFALPLAARLIDDSDDLLITEAEPAALRMLEQESAAPHDWLSAAAFIADFGSPNSQARLLELVSQGAKEAAPSPRYRALVAGVTNRYTANRLPYLRPILDDERPRPEPEASQFRYCDTAVARLSVIVHDNFVAEAASPTDRAAWLRGVERGRKWFGEHGDEVCLGRLVPPAASNAVRHVKANDGSAERRR